MIKYLGPGFQLVSFDPKISISMVGREAFAFEEMLELAADLAASDRFCGRLHKRITDRPPRRATPGRSTRTSASRSTP